MLENEEKRSTSTPRSAPKGPCHAIQSSTHVQSCSKSLPYTPQRHWNTALGYWAAILDAATSVHMMCHAGKRRKAVHEHTSKGPCHAIQSSTHVQSCSKSLPYTPQRHWNTALGYWASILDAATSVHMMCHAGKRRKAVHEPGTSRPKGAVPRHPEQYTRAELFQITSIHTPKTLEHCVGLLGFHS